MVWFNGSRQFELRRKVGTKHQKQLQADEVERFININQVARAGAEYHPRCLRHVLGNDTSKSEIWCCEQRYRVVKRGEGFTAR